MRGVAEMGPVAANAALHRMQPSGQGAPTPPTPPEPPQPPDFSESMNMSDPNIIFPESFTQLGHEFLIASVIIVALLVIVWPLMRLLTRWGERRMLTYALPPELDVRLSQLEQGVDSIAIEVERISEAQRFSAKVLAERAMPDERSEIARLEGPGTR